MADGILNDIRLYQIDLSYACFGVEVKDDKVVFAAPIAKWMIGKSWTVVKIWIDKKRGSIKEAKRIS